MRKRSWSWMARAQAWLDQKVNLSAPKPGEIKLTRWETYSLTAGFPIDFGKTYEFSMTMSNVDPRVVRIISGFPVPYDWSEDPDA